MIHYIGKASVFNNGNPLAQRNSTPVFHNLLGKVGISMSQTYPSSQVIR
ncbi:MAG: hypothetical protein U0V70_04195 [Terriglobia bacterium]